MRGRSPFTAPEPRFAEDADPVLAELCRSAAAAVHDAWRDHTRDALLGIGGDGADGTPSFLIDLLVEDRIVASAAALGVNIVSEEAGVVDVGSARTVFIDPLDGSANAGAGVPLSCFSACLAEDGRPLSALTCWLENGATVSATVGRPVGFATTGRRELLGAAVDLLRPKLGERGASDRAWWAIAERAARVRILSSSCLEAMLVAQGGIDAFADSGSDTHRIVDLAAALVIVPAAGGAVVDAFGRDIELDLDLSRRWSGVVAATAELAAEVAETISAALPGELATLQAAGRSWILRRAREADLPALRPLIGSLGLGSATDDIPEDQWRKAFRRIDASPEALLFVVVDAAERPVAFAHYGLHPELCHGAGTNARIETFVVAPELCGHGLGSALLGWLLRRARRDGVTGVTLSTNLAREDARRFYARHGFQETHAGLTCRL